MKNIYKTTIVVLVIINVILCIIAYGYFKSDQNEYIDLQKDSDIKTGVLKQVFRNALLNDDVAVLDSITPSEEQEKLKATLDSMQGNKPIFAVRVSELHCEECVRYILLKLVRMTKDTEMGKHVVLLVSYQNERYLPYLFKNLSVKFPICRVDEVPLDVELDNFPYCFVLNKEGKASHVFVPEKSMSDLANFYIKTINERYYSEK